MKTATILNVSVISFALATIFIFLFNFFVNSSVKVNDYDLFYIENAYAMCKKVYIKDISKSDFGLSKGVDWIYNSFLNRIYLDINLVWNQKEFEKTFIHELTHYIVHQNSKETMLEIYKKLDLIKEKINNVDLEKLNWNNKNYWILLRGIKTNIDEAYDKADVEEYLTFYVQENYIINWDSSELEIYNWNVTDSNLIQIQQEYVSIINDYIFKLK